MNKSYKKELKSKHKCETLANLVSPPLLLARDKCNGRNQGRTSSEPKSAHRLIVDKVLGLRSGILTYTSLVLLRKLLFSDDLKLEWKCLF